MSRRPGNPARRLVDVGSIPFVGSDHSKTRASPTLSAILLLVGVILIVGYCYSNSGSRINDREVLSKLTGTISCSSELQRALPAIKKAYGESLQRVLHVGPDSCSVVLNLLQEGENEAWGVDPYDVDDPDTNCRTLIRKGLVRVADIKFPLPYKSQSFSHVIVSDAFDYLSPRYLNKSIPQLTRVASDGLIVLTGLPGQQKAKVSELSKFGRPAKYRTNTWWVRYFLQSGLDENEAATKKFVQAATKMGYHPLCQIFHVKANN